MRARLGDVSLTQFRYVMPVARGDGDGDDVGEDEPPLDVGGGT